MRLYQCSFCNKICAHGEDDPGDYTTIGEHIVLEHYDKLLTFFSTYSLKGRDA